MILYLKDTKANSGEKNAYVIVSFFRALWNIILDNVKNIEIFLESDGFYSLMEFIEQSSYFQKKQALSFLSALLEDKRSMRYFEEWVSPFSNRNSTQLLLNIYRSED